MTLELVFRIDAFTPDTIPMARLADYMAALAGLLGNPAGVHFVRLEAGSLGLVQRVERPHRPAVVARLASLSRGEPAADVLRAYRKLDDLLAADGATGLLDAQEGSELQIAFPGAERPQPRAYGVVRQAGALDGIPIRVGGPGEMVPVHLQRLGEGDRFWTCQAPRPLARRIAQHLFEAVLRLRGEGSWRREPGGVWRLQRFVASDFEVLDDSPLGVVVERLRAVPNDGWRGVEDPFALLEELRGGEAKR